MSAYRQIHNPEIIKSKTRVEAWCAAALNTPPLLALLALMTALSIGVISATQPPEISLALMGGLVLVVLSLITPLTTFLVLIILSPLRTLIETEAALRLPFDIGQLLVVGVALSWFIYQTARQQRIVWFTWSPLYLLLIGFLIVTGLTAFSAFSIGAWLNEWLKWVVLSVMVLMVMNLRKWEWLIFGLVVAGVGNALVGVYIYFGGSGALHLLISDNNFRAFGTFGQPNPFGGFMGLLIPLAFTTALAYGLHIWRGLRQTRQVRLMQLGIGLFYGSATLLLVIALVMSWSRGAWLAFGGSMVVVVVALPRKFWQSLLLLMLITVIAIVLWTSGRLPSSIVERITSSTQELFAFSDVRGVTITSENFAVIERLAHWQAAVNMAQANPLFGVGFGNYEIAYEQYRLINWEEALGHAHNYYLNVLAETGIIGLAGYLSVWVGVFWLTWRSRRHPDLYARFSAVGLLGTWTYLAVHSLTDNLYVNNVFLHLGTLLGILACLYQQTVIISGKPQAKLSGTYDYINQQYL